MVEIISSNKVDYEALYIYEMLIEDGIKLGENDHKWLLEHADAYGFNADEVTVRDANEDEEIHLSANGTFR